MVRTTTSQSDALRKALCAEPTSCPENVCARNAHLGFNVNDASLHLGLGGLSLPLNRLLGSSTQQPIGKSEACCQCSSHQQLHHASLAVTPQQVTLWTLGRKGLAEPSMPVRGATIQWSAWKCSLKSALPCYQLGKHCDQVFQDSRHPENILVRKALKRLANGLDESVAQCAVKDRPDACSMHSTAVARQRGEKALTTLRKVNTTPFRTKAPAKSPNVKGRAARASGTKMRNAAVLKTSDAPRAAAPSTTANSGPAAQC